MEDLRKWLDEYDKAEQARLAADAAAEKRICGQCKTMDTFFCGKCRPLLQ